MKLKKNPKYDIEKQRGLFFLMGLAAVLAIALYAFQYEVIKTTPVLKGEPKNEVYSTLVIPITKPEREEPQKKEKKIKLEPKPINTDEFKPVDDDEPIDEPNEKLPIEQTTIIDDEPRLVEDEPQTVDLVVVERIARPNECAELSNRDEQMRCLNEYLQYYINKHVKYPAIAREMNEEGKVYVEFVVSETGAIDTARIAREVSPALEEEALRVIKNLPRFVPASQQGREVKMRMTVPVNFKLH